MNILVIGNGFDLAHGLPTKYDHFLDFCQRVRGIYTYDEEVLLNDYRSKNIDDWNMNDYIKNALLEAFDKRDCKKDLRENGTYCLKVTTPNKFLNEFYDCIRENVWLNFFGKRKFLIGKNWIDFEKEMSKVIKRLDYKLCELRNNILKLSNENERLSKEYLKQETIQCLCDDLDRLIRAFEIYLTDYVEQINLKVVSHDITNIFLKIKDSISLKQCQILSFNYTNTFERLYSNLDTISFEYDFVHGSANINNTLGTNNMVLGVDEYPTGDKKDHDIDLIAFKKYYQRIYKEVGCKYKSWIDAIRTNDNFREIKRMYDKEFPLQVPFEYFADKHYVYIFGHSLDITDRDILRELILNDNVYTTIFYKDKDQQGQQIENLFKVIGKDELIRRTAGTTKTVEFKLQCDMVETEYDLAKRAYNIYK